MNTFSRLYTTLGTVCFCKTVPEIPSARGANGKWPNYLHREMLLCVLLSMQEPNYFLDGTAVNRQNYDNSSLNFK